MTPEELNALVSDAAVLEQLGLVRLDLSGFFERPGNIALGDASGAALFGHRGHGVYEGHYIFSPGCRGKVALARAKAFLETMFTKYGAHLIVGQTPEGNKPARLFSRALGFTPQGTSVCNGRLCVIYHMEREQWATLSAVSSAE
jgi:RimJ/RimL family protein N-acetyltransferase